MDAAKYTIQLRQVLALDGLFAYLIDQALGAFLERGQPDDGLRAEYHPVRMAFLPFSALGLFQGHE